MKFFKVRSGFFAALAVAFGLPAQAAWVNINTFSSAESDYTWKAVHFLNTDTGWAVGSFKVNSTTTRGAILKTTNGGVTWTDQSILTNTEYSAIWFSDAQNGIIMGAGNRPGARTTDGGQTWTSVQASGYAMDFVSAMHGWIAGDNSTGRRTTDGGATWTAVTGLAGSFVDFTDMVTGWRIANQEQVLKTTDGGAT